MADKVNALPPKEIYDVLHEFEERGGTLPESVDKWWFEETNTNEIKRQKLNIRR
jgi:hypothetical protein